MSIQQTQNFRLLLNLLRQLRAFGLNPYDWRIERAFSNQGDQIQMYHRRDDDFRFRGSFRRSERGELVLQSLKLASL